MALITWNSAFSVHVAALDAQHQDLVLFINRLSEAMDNHRGQEAAAGVLTGLHAFSRYHLAAEEGLMLTHHYPKYARHQSEHDAWVRQVHDLRADLLVDGTVPPQALLDLLVSWWMNHCLVSDRHLGAYLRLRGVGEQTIDRPLSRELLANR